MSLTVALTILGAVVLLALLGHGWWSARRASPRQADAPLAAPQRVERLVLVDASGPAFEPQSLPIGFLVARVPVLNRLGEVLLPRPLVAASVANVYGDPSKVTSALKVNSSAPAR